MRRRVATTALIALLVPFVRCAGETTSDQQPPADAAAMDDEPLDGKAVPPDASVHPVDAPALVSDAGATFSISENACTELPDGCSSFDAESFKQILQKSVVQQCPTYGNFPCSGFVLSFDSNGCIATIEPIPSHRGWTQSFLDCFFAKLTSTRWPCAASASQAVVYTAGSCTT